MPITFVTTGRSITLDEKDEDVQLLPEGLSKATWDDVKPLLIKRLPDLSLIDLEFKLPEGCSSSTSLGEIQRIQAGRPLSFAPLELPPFTVLSSEVKREAFKNSEPDELTAHLLRQGRSEERYAAVGFIVGDKIHMRLRPGFPYTINYPEERKNMEEAIERFGHEIVLMTKEIESKEQKPEKGKLYVKPGAEGFRYFALGMPEMQEMKKSEAGSIDTSTLVNLQGNKVAVIEAIAKKGRDYRNIAIAVKGAPGAVHKQVISQVEAEEPELVAAAKFRTGLSCFLMPDRSLTWLNRSGQNQRLAQIHPLVLACYTADLSYPFLDHPIYSLRYHLERSLQMACFEEVTVSTTSKLAATGAVTESKAGLSYDEVYNENAEKEWERIRAWKNIGQKKEMIGSLLEKNLLYVAAMAPDPDLQRSESGYEESIKNIFKCAKQYGIKLDLNRDPFTHGPIAASSSTSKGEGLCLHHAARNGYLELCKQFVAHGARLDVEDASLRTPLDYAASEGHWPTAKWLFDTLEESEKRNALPYMALCAKKVISSGQPENLTDVMKLASSLGPDFSKPALLKEAARLGSAELLKLLLPDLATASVEALAFLKVVDEEELISKAIQNKHPQFVLALLEVERTVKTRSAAPHDFAWSSDEETGGALFMEALSQGQPQVALEVYKGLNNPQEFMQTLQTAFDDDRETKEGFQEAIQKNDFVHHSVKAGAWPLVRLLVDNGANLCQLNAARQMPLHGVIQQQEVKVLRDFLKRNLGDPSATLPEEKELAKLVQLALTQYQKDKSSKNALIFESLARWQWNKEEKPFDNGPLITQLLKAGEGELIEKLTKGGAELGPSVKLALKAQAVDGPPEGSRSKIISKITLGIDENKAAAPDPGPAPAPAPASSPPSAKA